MSGGLKEVGEDVFQKEVIECEVPVVVDFWAGWCMPCRMIAPVIEELSKEYEGRVKFAKVNVDDNTQLATDLHILSIPTLILFKEGKEVKRIVGVNSKSHIVKEIEAIM